MLTSRPFDAKEVAWIAKILGATDEVDLGQLRGGMTVELEHGMETEGGVEHADG